MSPKSGISDLKIGTCDYMATCTARCTHRFRSSFVAQFVFFADGLPCAIVCSAQNERYIQIDKQRIVQDGESASHLSASSIRMHFAHEGEFVGSGVEWLGEMCGEGRAIIWLMRERLLSPHTDHERHVCELSASKSSESGGCIREADIAHGLNEHDESMRCPTHR
jgi:hypothetical protein